jgi:two-component system, NarL family, sensor histidine kinase UhpB
MSNRFVDFQPNNRYTLKILLPSNSALSMTKPTRILLIENSESDIKLITSELDKFGFSYDLTQVTSFDAISEALQQNYADIIVCDYVVSQLTPLDAIGVLRSIARKTPFIICSNVLSEDLVVQCMKAGASDYIFKQHLARLGPAIHNILETKRIQQELQRSRERFNTLAKVSTVGIFLASAEGYVLYVNERWNAICGLTSEKALGDGFLNAVHSHDRKRVTTEWHRSVRERMPFHSEYRIFRESDNTEVWVLGQALPEFSGDGGFAGFVGTITDISHRMNMEVEIDASRKQLRALSVRLQSIREEERTEISREIHDDLGQALTGLRMDLVWLNNKIPKSDEKVAHRMKAMMELIDGTIHKVRKISTDLRPGILDDIGLAAALEWHGNDVGERSGIEFTFDLIEDLQLDGQRSTTFFRIFQESLTNVMRHSQAKHVHVSLRKEGNMLLLMIEDDGKGISPQDITNPRSVGILGMKERAAVFNGEVSFIGVPGKGTTVRIRIPLNA